MYFCIFLVKLIYLNFNTTISITRSPVELYKNRNSNLSKDNITPTYTCTYPNHREVKTGTTQSHKR